MLLNYLIRLGIDGLLLLLSVISLIFAGKKAGVAVVVVVVEVHISSLRLGRQQVHL